MTAVADCWRLMEAEGRTEPGWHVRRIQPAAACAVYAGLHQPERTPGLLLELAVDDVPANLVFPRSSGFLIEPSFLPGGTPQTRYALSLADPHYRAIFGVLCQDVAEAAAAAGSARSALREWVARLHAWQAFMARHGADGLSETAALGLLGALLVLRDELTPRRGVAAALDMWTGPAGEPNDFTLPAGFLEVKTTARQAPDHLDISNIDQLDHARGHILLAHLRLLHDAAGETLPAVVNDVQQMVAQEVPHRLDELRGHLMNVGYVALHAERYARAYRRDRMDLFAIRDGFPRLARSELRRGIRSCSYTIELAACADFLVHRSVLNDLIAEGAHA